jgi:hypothetical protein
LKSAASRDSDEPSRPPTSVGIGEALGAPAASAADHPRTPFGRLRGGLPQRPSGASQLLTVVRSPANASDASASVSQGDSHATTTGASAPARGVCSVMWGSASADRSITASVSPPRTPSPAFGLGPRLFRARRRGSSEPRRPVPAPPEPPDPMERTPAIEAGSPVFGPADPPRRGTGRRGSSEPARPKAAEALRSPRSWPPEPGDGALRSAALPRSPEFGPPALRSRCVPSRHGRNPPLHRGRPAALRNREPTSRDPGDGALRSPAHRSPDPAHPALRSLAAPSAGIGPSPFGARSPLPRLALRSYAPRTSGDRGRQRTPASAGAQCRAGR